MTIAAAVAVVGVVASLASAGVGAYSAEASAAAQKASAKFNAAVATNNATAATQQAQYEADRIRARNRVILAQGRANYLKSGVDISGSAADVQMDSAVQGELEEQAAIYTGRVSAGENQAQAMLDRMRGSYAGQAGDLAMGGSILSGTSSAAASWSSYYRNNPTFNTGANING